jgi:hypothetical protein
MNGWALVHQVRYICPAYDIIRHRLEFLVIPRTWADLGETAPFEPGDFEFRAHVGILYENVNAVIYCAHDSGMINVQSFIFTNYLYAASHFSISFLDVHYNIAHMIYSISYQYAATQFSMSFLDISLIGVFSKQSDQEFRKSFMNQDTSSVRRISWSWENANWNRAGFTV